MSKRTENPAGAATPPGSKKRSAKLLDAQQLAQISGEENYLAWAAIVRDRHAAGADSVISVQHDAHCGIYLPLKVCTCRPNRTLRDETGRICARWDNGPSFHPSEAVPLGYYYRGLK